jgi:hypothetical protein
LLSQLVSAFQLRLVDETLKLDLEHGWIMDVLILTYCTDQQIGWWSKFDYQNLGKLKFRQWLPKFTNISQLACQIYGKYSCFSCACQIFDLAIFYSKPTRP